MTRIASVRALPLLWELRQPWDFSIEKYRYATCVVVEVTTDSGLVGYGEAIARKAPHATAAVVRELLAPLAVGRPLRDAGAIWRAGFEALRRWGHHRGLVLEALSGLDIALWDLRARQLGCSVADLLPGGAAGRVPVYASSIYFTETVEQAAGAAASLVAEGYPAIKIKIGYEVARGGLRRDLQTVAAIREAVGPAIELMVDANGAYTLADAVRFVTQAARFDLAWIEEPFPPDDLDAYAQLAARSAVPVAAGESEFAVFGFRDLIGRGAIAVAQPDIARCGGFTGALQIAAYCFAHRVSLCPHTGFSGGINNLAGALLAASATGAGRYEHMVIDNPLRDLFETPLPEPVAGWLEVPDGPGLGRTVDPRKLDAARPADDHPTVQRRTS